MRYLALAALLMAGTAQAEDSDWTRQDTYREAVYITLHTLDWLQTRGLAKHGWDNHYESNPLLGEYPSVGRLNMHYIITSAGHMVIANLLPPDWRHAWQYIAIGDAGAAVWNNHLVGVRIKF